MDEAPRSASPSGYRNPAAGRHPPPAGTGDRADVLRCLWTLVGARAWDLPPATPAAPGKSPAASRLRGERDGQRPGEGDRARLSLPVHRELSHKRPRLRPPLGRSELWAPPGDEIRQHNLTGVLCQENTRGPRTQWVRPDSAPSRFPALLPQPGRPVGKERAVRSAKGPLEMPGRAAWKGEAEPTERPAPSPSPHSASPTSRRGDAGCVRPPTCSPRVSWRPAGAP